MIVKSFRKIVLFFICFIMLVSLTTPIYASTDTSNNTIEIVSREKAVIIENKIQEMSSLRLQLALLNNDEQKLTSSKYIESIEKSIDNLKSEIFKLGAKNPSEEFMEKLLLSSYKEQLKSSEGSTILMDNWHPSEIIEQFQGMYDVTGYPTSHNGRTQYHLIFVNNGSDPYLHKTSTKSIYDAFSAGSQTSSYWVNELLKIYGEKLTGSGLGLIHPLLEWVPWELFFSLKPPSQEISSSGDATLFSLNTVTTIKFVFVYDDINDEWFYALSTNCVNYGYTITQMISRNGVAYNDSINSSDNWEDGNYFTAWEDADAAYLSGHSTKTTIYKFAVHSTSYKRDEINISIHSPTFVAHML